MHGGIPHQFARHEHRVVARRVGLPVPAGRFDEQARPTRRGRFLVDVDLPGDGRWTTLQELPGGDLVRRERHAIGQAERGGQRQGQLRIGPEQHQPCPRPAAESGQHRGEHLRRREPGQAKVRQVDRDPPHVDQRRRHRVGRRLDRGLRQFAAQPEYVRVGVAADEFGRQPGRRWRRVTELVPARSELVERPLRDPEKHLARTPHVLSVPFAAVTRITPEGLSPTGSHNTGLPSSWRGDADALGPLQRCAYCGRFVPQQLERDMDPRPTDLSLNDIDRRTVLAAAVLIGVGGRSARPVPGRRRGARRCVSALVPPGGPATAGPRQTQVGTGEGRRGGGCRRMAGHGVEGVRPPERPGDLLTRVTATGPAPGRAAPPRVGWRHRASCRSTGCGS